MKLLGLHVIIPLNKIDYGLEKELVYWWSDTGIVKLGNCALIKKRTENNDNSK